MKPKVIFDNSGLRRKYNDLKAEIKALRRENNYLRNQQTRQLEEQNEMIRKLLRNINPEAEQFNKFCDIAEECGVGG